ncbi:hypothetical protein NLN86_24440 [Citrobacter portucalensis]|uniref:Ead/Ea22-like family protein n=1 Tax=Citrobacter portucalensis TaxID=1639133 RepID=A0AAW5WBX5_9ENTR|nr:hypothetical protein [Citrobacter portucalensis]MCX9004764.1 hypothetical protein [Citrobacter portucalensis]
MGSNIIELAKLGHERAAELKASCGAVDVRSLAQLISDLATQLEVQFVRSTNMAVQLANSESKCRELAAENSGQKSGVTYFAFAPEYGFDYFANKQDAIDTAQAEIDAYRDDAFDGWDEDVRRVSWGIVIQRADGVDADGVHISDSRHTYQTCDYQLVDMVKTPATDAFLDEVRASCVDAVKQNISDAISGCYQDEMAGLDAAVNIASEFAAKLRGGR